jgi:hypothetical protein
MLSLRFYTLVGIIISAAMMRILPHPPNFTPVAAIALFGGAYFIDRRWAFAIPLAAMLLSDIVLGVLFYGLDTLLYMPLVYTSFVLTVCLGFLIRQRRSALGIGAAALASSLLFFIIPNLGVWMRGHLYSRTLEGLVACYVAAIPFFRNTLAGTFFYTILIFGGFALAERCFRGLRQESS